MAKKHSASSATEQDYQINLIANLPPRFIVSYSGPPIEERPSDRLTSEEAYNGLHPLEESDGPARRNY